MICGDVELNGRVGGGCHWCDAQLFSRGVSTGVQCGNELLSEGEPGDHRLGGASSQMHQ